MTSRHTGPNLAHKLCLFTARTFSEKKSHAFDCKGQHEVDTE